MGTWTERRNGGIFPNRRRSTAKTRPSAKKNVLPFAGAHSAPLGAAAGTLNMRDLERRAIEEALQRHEGNRTHAARELGISLRTLQYRLKEYGLA